jgi:hypothetical protein
MSEMGAVGLDGRSAFSRPARAQGSSPSADGQRPRNARRSFPDPKGVALPPTAARKAGVMPGTFDPSRVGRCGGPFSGGVAPGYYIHPLRGSRMGSAEEVLGAQGAGKKVSVPFALSSSTERSNSSSFWRGAAGDEGSLQRRDSTTAEILRFAQNDSFRGDFPQPVKPRPSGPGERSRLTFL